MQNEIESLDLDMNLQIITAFSRDGPSKTYVQHRLKEFKDQVWPLLYDEKAYFYLCGDAKNMAHDVTLTLETISIEKLGKPKGQKFIKTLKSQNRFHEDVW